MVSHGLEKQGEISPISPDSSETPPSDTPPTTRYFALWEEVVLALHTVYSLSQKFHDKASKLFATPDSVAPELMSSSRVSNASHYRLAQARILRDARNELESAVEFLEDLEETLNGLVFGAQQLDEEADEQDGSEDEE